MKKVIFFMISAMVVLSCNQNREQSEQDAKPARLAGVKDGVFIHITESYNDPHRVLMPLKMANMMAPEKDVVVYMDIHAVELLVKGASDIKSPEFDSYQEYIRQLLDKKVGIYACPTCLSVAGYNPGDLMEGVQVAMKDKFFNFTEGRILTMNY